MVGRCRRRSERCGSPGRRWRRSDLKKAGSTGDGVDGWQVAGTERAVQATVPAVPQIGPVEVEREFVAAATGRVAAATEPAVVASRDDAKAW